MKGRAKPPIAMRIKAFECFICALLLLCVAGFKVCIRKRHELPLMSRTSSYSLFWGSCIVTGF